MDSAQSSHGAHARDQIPQKISQTAWKDRLKGVDNPRLSEALLRIVTRYNQYCQSCQNQINYGLNIPGSVRLVTMNADEFLCCAVWLYAKDHELLSWWLVQTWGCV